MTVIILLFAYLLYQPKSSECFNESGNIYWTIIKHDGRQLDASNWRSKQSKLTAKWQIVRRRFSCMYQKGVKDYVRWRADTRAWHSGQRRVLEQRRLETPRPRQTWQQLQCRQRVNHSTNKITGELWQFITGVDDEEPTHQDLRRYDQKSLIVNIHGQILFIAETWKCLRNEGGKPNTKAATW